ncbi:hypothetical protein HDG34_007535 [Paraburkholderia sp. HC6.4b]|uniref:phosphatase PAP2 family protein n=1 Tax=unclassified Paraburkholderia TaxID=2615204 RepID=UPI0016108F71|nr:MULTISPECIES: phosphatase PAP2 family protein [unclassified Paraburkholderia]MBB5413557.1 hypothetical protein [Paraburkholderia sp. HC6.4b]MBB5455950.1 hypothetical protein [Paraburkholderia sp. Kb1A]
MPVDHRLSAPSTQSRQGRQTIGITCAYPSPDSANKKMDEHNVEPRTRTRGTAEWWALPAIVFIYALRRTPRLLLFAIPLNVTMILSTPTQGGHYLADVIAGLLLSAQTIAALKRCMHLLATRKAAKAPSSRSMPVRTA